MSESAVIFDHENEAPSEAESAEFLERVRTSEQRSAKTMREALDDKEVHVSPAPPKVAAYPQLQQQLGDALSTLETELQTLGDNLTSVLAPGDEVPLAEIKAPGASPMATDMTTYINRVLHAGAIAHDFNKRIETGA